MNPVVHFEMPYDDQNSMARFYEKAFGWQNQMLGPEMGNYVVTTTTPTGASGPLTPGAINGGFFPRKPVMIPGIGQYVSFMDTEGNRVSMLQPLPRGTVNPS